MKRSLEERRCHVLQLETRLETVHSESKSGPLSSSPLLCSSIEEMWPCGSSEGEVLRARCCCHAWRHHQPWQTRTAEGAGVYSSNEGNATASRQRRQQRPLLSMFPTLF